jgi:hypothetical protein
MKRFIARYSGKDGFEERYEVIDTHSGESVSDPLPYHQANDQSEARNTGTWPALMEPMSLWLGGLRIG